MALKEIEYDKKKFKISYNIEGKGDRAILILHGWGSNKEIMSKNLSPHFKILKQIYIDLPGFGNSPNEHFLKTSDYAKIVKKFLKEINQEVDIVAGHSFGGKVATLMKPNNLVLLSSAGILVPKPLDVKIKIALSKIFKNLGLSKINKIFVANDAKEMNEGMYETFKYVVNEDFEDNFKNYQGKALLFWGKDDTATPLWTGEKINNLISNSKLYPLDGDHFFFVKHSKFIAQTIENEL